MKILRAVPSRVVTLVLCGSLLATAPVGGAAPAPPAGPAAPATHFPSSPS